MYFAEETPGDSGNLVNICIFLPSIFHMLYPSYCLNWNPLKTTDTNLTAYCFLKFTQCPSKWKNKKFIPLKIEKTLTSLNQKYNKTILTSGLMNCSLTGKFAGWRWEAAAVQGPSHQHDTHLLCGALEHLHVPVLHRLFMTLLGHHKSLVRWLHLDEGITRGPTLQIEGNSQKQNPACTRMQHRFTK